MKVCMQETESVMSALHSVAQAQLGPACRSDHEQDQHLAASVCVWNDMMKACMQETESVMSALHNVAQAQLGPACRSDHEQDQQCLLRRLCTLG